MLDHSCFPSCLFYVLPGNLLNISGVAVDSIVQLLLHLLYTVERSENYLVLQFPVGVRTGSVGWLLLDYWVCSLQGKLFLLSLKYSERSTLWRAASSNSKPLLYSTVAQCLRVIWWNHLRHFSACKNVVLVSCCKERCVGWTWPFQASTFCSKFT